jgi:hypothetical protein
MTHGHGDYSPTKDRTEDIELLPQHSAPRTTHRPIGESSNAEPEIDNAEDFPNMQATRDQSLIPLEDRSPSDGGSENQRERHSIIESSSSNGTGLESPGDSEAQGLTSESPTDENQDLSASKEYNLLDKLRDKILFRLVAGVPDTERVFIIKAGPKAMPVMRKGKVLNLEWFAEPETEEGEKAKDVSDDIKKDWPQSEIVNNMEQILVQSDGMGPVREVPAYTSEYKGLWREWCLDAAESQQEDDVKLKRILNYYCYV